MSVDLEALTAQREAEIALLRELYRFSAVEAQDFIDRYPAEHEKPQVERPA